MVVVGEGGVGGVVELYWLAEVLVPVFGGHGGGVEALSGECGVEGGVCGLGGDGGEVGEDLLFEGFDVG